jgi:hypothetical protein
VPFGHHKKRSFLEGGKGFKLGAFSNDVYPLLPKLWHAILPSEKRVVMAIVERNGGYTLKCLHELLYFEAHVLYPLCVSAALENPHYLDFGVPTDDPGENVTPELAAAVATQLPVTHGLATFQLKPPGLTGDALFAHMVAFRARNSAQERPSTFLEVEMTEEQAAILAPTMQGLSAQSIFKDAGGAGATKSWRSGSSTTPAPSKITAGCRTTQSGSKSCSPPSS